MQPVKKILIISPHFPPSNLAAVHRSRLFAQHLPEFGWEPVILTVHEKYYEEKPDYNLQKLLSPSLRVEKANAFSVTRPRIIGDIGLRGFFQLYKKAKQIIDQDKIDFLYIPVPSFYTALLGRWLHLSTGVKYGIDYIDPWVHNFPGSEKIFSRHWFSTKLARLMEPIAVKKVSLVTGVAEGYYKGVIERNPALKNRTVFGAMPYGGEKRDHIIVKELGLRAYLFDKKPDKIQLVYAGAMLPKAYAPLEEIFKALYVNKELARNFEFHFIGTGKTTNDPGGYNIKDIALRYQLWNDIVFEYPARVPYLDVLAHLESADGVFILGSTEPHYTPSKVYQAVLSGKPILAVLHNASTAASVIQQTGAGVVLSFYGEQDLKKIEQCFGKTIAEFSSFIKLFNKEQVDQQVFEQYSARTVTGSLVKLLDQLI